LPTLELGGISLGVREGVIILISLVAIYMVFELWRMRRIRHKRLSAAQPETPPTLEPSVEPLAGSAAEASGAAEELWERAPAGMAEEMMRQSLEQEMAQLRDEVDSIRGELAALREDMLQELAHVQASQSVSPIYGDAMQMALAGYEPAMIAERCGIARAEAELVVALAKSQERGGAE
jgi:hypothetical protein